ncbi:MAG: methyltransferase domain-containing protein [Verrucomicrobia bacterium]|nr:methyltransferase domain-containing protein [Verrucomicrobiota bacterium]
MPGEHLDPAKMPGHWLLARMGKRVLRPGGLELTRKMLAELKIGTRDDVVEFAPGLGLTARLALSSQPLSYTAIERDETAATLVRSYLSGPRQKCQQGSAEKTGLQSATASVVYGEAMLTMQGNEQKAAIVGEAFRLLKPGGRYGIHELALTPDDLPEAVKSDLSQAISGTIRHGARPLTIAEWKTILQSAGFSIENIEIAPMHLLEPRRIIADEGFFRALKFIFNVLTTPAARNRVRSMRVVFRKHGRHLGAVMIVASKPFSS